MVGTMTLDDELGEIIAKIQSTAPNPVLIMPATANLADLLRFASEEARFDAADWQREWSVVMRPMPKAPPP